MMVQLAGLRDNAAVPESSPPMLTYADPPASAGALIDRAADGVTITIPPSHRMAARVAIVMPLGMIVGETLAIPWYAWPAIISRAFVWLPLLITFCCLFYVNERRRTVFVASPRGLTMTITPMLGWPMAMSWTIHELTDIKFSDISRQIVIRAHQRDMIELRPFESEIALRWFVQTLRDAIWLENPTEPADPVRAA